jgi:ferritin-like metal-binding protein YciE
MGLFTKDIASMEDLFVHQLKDIYYAEKRIVNALPAMIEKANSAELKKGFENHLAETLEHVNRVERIFQKLGATPEAVKCSAIDGIIEEADEIAGEVADDKVLDAALIAAAQAVEHYEISRYGCLIAWAKERAENECATILQQTVSEEKATDKKLTNLAESRVNSLAAE